MSTTVAAMQAQAEEFRDRYDAVREMIGRVIVGHDDIVHGVLTAILCGGHCLLEGVPGLGKTMLVRTLSRVLDLDFNRIQFTPDLMPADILGTNMIVEDADGQIRIPARSGLYPNPACRRNQSSHAEDSVRNVGNNARRNCYRGRHAL